MILKEEDIAKILKKDKLAEIGNRMIPSIEADIRKIRNTKIPLAWNKAAVEKYNDYMNNFWELKDSVVSFENNNKFSNENKKSAEKVISIWRVGFGKLIELEDVITDYNKRFPNNKLKCLEELTGKKPTPSVKTDYFGY